MSRSLGPLLPDRLLAWLHEPPVAAPPGSAEPVVVVLTVDPYGWPHPALASLAELAAIDAQRLRLALGVASRSARNLVDAGRATLLFADARLCFYVKADALALPRAAGAEGMARFELVVRDVLEDTSSGDEPGVALGTGLTAVRGPGAEPSASRHARLRSVLLA